MELYPLLFLKGLKMPNHVKNRITGSKEAISRILRVTDEGKTVVDFHLIIPRPDSVSNDSVGMHIEMAAQIALGLIDFRSQPKHDAAKEFMAGNYGAATEVLRYSNAVRQLTEGPFVKDFSDSDFEVFIKYLRSHRENEGLLNWHDWNCAKWGTKWNAYDCEVKSETEVMFETAWSAPHPVIEALAIACGDGHILHEWADEDTGSNTGYREYVNGVVAVEKCLQGREAYEMSFRLEHADPDNYVLVGDSYECRDED